MARRRRVQKKPKVQTKKRIQKGKGIFDPYEANPKIHALMLRFKKAYGL
jgi:hypothetical protein